ncbi:hypothetical protein TNCV_737151 [Trichonephila clavipes]|nr:hypothetical protein TNCV_737151 [Trichonephila clavipes]
MIRYRDFSATAATKRDSSHSCYAPGETPNPFTVILITMRAVTCYTNSSDCAEIRITLPIETSDNGLSLNGMLLNHR